MILTVDIEAKSIGNKQLFSSLQFTVAPREKVGLIGRNGVGKTTLFHMLAGNDTDFSGTVQLGRGVRLVSTAQEHHAVAEQSVLHYILHNLPEYSRLKHILDTYPATMGDDVHKITTYSNALERFSNLDYFRAEEEIVRSLEQYRITPAMAEAPMAQLSGGQKRFVELVRVEHADADIALIDEPTNHMDYAAKALFVEWLKAVRQTVLVITHDRDVLQYVDKIIEIKDGRALVFKGNYEAYLKQNVTITTMRMHDYEVGQRTLENLQQQIQAVRAKKASTNKTPNPFIPLERRLLKEYDDLASQLDKPSFWIDRESAEGLGKKAGENYQKFKAKNIRIQGTRADTHASELLALENVVLGYNDQPLFHPVQFRLSQGMRLRLIGRNGAGKTTLVQAIAAASRGEAVPTRLHGTIRCGTKLRFSIYEQELRSEDMQRTLAEAIEHIYRSHDLPATDEVVKRVMGDYLFDPQQDGRLLVEQLSGGQKSRLQIIRMLAGNPNLLILDEPTNHLDLPSIEELENALANYHGAILYITHDSYFAKNLGGDQLTLQQAAD